MSKFVKLTVITGMREVGSNADDSFPSHDFTLNADSILHFAEAQSVMVGNVYSTITLKPEAAKSITDYAESAIAIPDSQTHCVLKTVTRT